MFRHRSIASLALALLLSGAATAQAQQSRPVWPDEGPLTWAPRPTEAAITPNDLRTRLYGFAADSMMGRRVGELGNLKGTDYIAREFERLGLEPAGENGTYFQTLPYGPIGFDRAASRLSVGGRNLAASSDWIPAAPSRGLQVGEEVDLSDVPAVFAGRWGDASVRLDPAVFRGKVAVFLGGPTVGRRQGPLLSCDRYPDRFGAAAAVIADQAAARASQAAGRAAGRPGPTFRGDEAQRAGAVAVLFVALEEQSEATVAGAFTTRGSMRPEGTGSSAPGAAFISNAAAARLFDRPLDQLTVGATGRGISGHWSYEWHMSQWPARNVIAVLPGSDPARAGEYVMVSAHNDHVGINNTVVDHDSLRAINIVTRRQGANDPVCRPTPSQQRRIDSLIAHARSIRPPRRDSIMNGADDDGSGTVIMLEIAERFATEHPARSILFISHQGEEGGLLGSRWFTDHPTIPLESIVAAHNMDMEAKGRVDQVKFGGHTSLQTLGSRRLSREFGDVIDSVNAVRDEVMAIDHTWDQPSNPMNRFCRSDQVNYVHHDVPVTYFSTGYSYDYHQQTDEPQYADYDHMTSIGNFIHDVMMAIAQRPNRPAISGPDPSYPQCR